MGKGKRLTLAEMSKIDSLKDAGWSNRKIAIYLKRSHDVVNNYSKNKENYGKYENSGKKTRLTSRDKRHIFNKAVNGNLSCSQIKLELQLPVTVRRIQQVLKENNFSDWKKRQGKPKLTIKHKISRLAFAEKYMIWDNEWKIVLFSDEKKFNFDGPDGCQYYWHDLRKEEEKCYSRNFGGGSLMVWGAFSFAGKLPLAFISTKMKATDYIDLLQIKLVDSAEPFFAGKFVFQHDNASIHVAKITKKWLEDNNIDVLEWPAVSPDLNPIENLWGILVRGVYANGRQFDQIADLEKAIRQCWNDIDLSITKNLVSSMKKRIFNVIKANGAQTKY